MSEKIIVSFLLTDKTGMLYPSIFYSLYPHHFKDQSFGEAFSLITNALSMTEDHWIKTRGIPDDKDRAKFSQKAMERITRFSTTLIPQKSIEFWKELWSYGMEAKLNKSNEEIEAMFKEATSSLLAF